MSRPFKDDKKIQVGLKLPPYLLDWMKQQEKSKAVLIEEAMVKQYEIKKQ